MSASVTVVTAACISSSLFCSVNGLFEIKLSKSILLDKDIIIVGFMVLFRLNQKVSSCQGVVVAGSHSHIMCTLGVHACETTEA